MIVRAARPDDCPALAELDALCNPSPWSARQFAACLAHAHETVLLAEHGRELAGLMVWQKIADEAELHLIDTAPAMRRRGVASLLLQHLFDQAAAQGVHRIVLEVRRSNPAAQALYRRHGFRACGRRPNYYPLPDGSREEAILMEKPC
ncbi:MAG: ribosomal protein S18-alanine N-acetyltransferase [Eikenella sp.]|nr:ribosomal protein S18-alanine N-acetyltransferase [Eikenella sp.]